MLQSCDACVPQSDRIMYFLNCGTRFVAAFRALFNTSVFDEMLETRLECKTLVLWPNLGLV